MKQSKTLVLLLSLCLAVFFLSSLVSGEGETDHKCYYGCCQWSGYGYKKYCSRCCHYKKEGYHPSPMKEKDSSHHGGGYHGGGHHHGGGYHGGGHGHGGHGGKHGGSVGGK